MSKLTDSIDAKIKKDVDMLGYEIEYIEYVKEGKVNILRIVIDKPGVFLTTDDLECVSRKVEDMVDELMPNSDAYTLEVSSPGLERQLKSEALYKKYIGSNIKVSLYSKHEKTNSKEIEGILENIDSGKITIKLAEEKIEIELKNIASAHTVYDF